MQMVDKLVVVLSMEKKWVIDMDLLNQKLMLKKLKKMKSFNK